MDISFVLRRSGGADSPALGLEDGAPLTYRELAARANAYANTLTRLGVKPGDHVGILLYNCLEYWLAYFAVTRLGAVAVRLNFRLAADELEFALVDSCSTTLLVDDELLERLASGRERLPLERYVVRGDAPDSTTPWTELEQGETHEPSPPLPGASAPAMLMYTSGTTGRPKGALWSHGTTAWFAAMQIAEWNLGPETVTMVTGPLYHVAGIEDFTLPTLFTGGRVVFMESGGFTVERALRLAQSQSVTDLALFPSMIYQLLQSPECAAVDLGAVRRMFTGGDAVVPWAVEQLHERYPWIDLVQVYGLTEGTPVIACSAPGSANANPAAVGRVMPFGELSIRDDGGAEVADGGEGEIWTRSPANSLGYWQRPDANAETFVDGWCKTGDLGRLSDGLLTVTGRKKDMIRSGGENIYPAEIEDVLLRHPSIVGAAVIGVPDPTYIETVCAVIVPTNDGTLSAADVIAYCTRHLAGYKKPTVVEFVDEIPRTPSHKIMKHVLRERFGGSSSEAT